MLDNERWLSFWFKPYLYLHASWMQDLDQRLITEQSSSLAWHVAYPYICAIYQLPQRYQTMTEGMVNSVVSDLVNGDENIIEMASFMLSGSCKPGAISLAMRRVFLQRSRALSLKKRLYEPTHNIAESDSGLLLVYLLCMCVDANSWQRIRLLFDKQRVSAIENNSQAIAFSDANKKAVQRAWNEIYQLKREIEAEHQRNLAHEEQLGKPDHVAASNDDEIIDAEVQLSLA